MFTKKQVIKGISWNGAGMVIHHGIEMVVKLVLVYYLLPEHFGLIGMAGVFVALISTYTDLGIGAALIQRKEENLRPEHWHTTYWLNFVVSWLGFAIITLVMAPLASWYYKQSILTPLCIVISLGLLWSPLVFVRRVRLQKKLQFKKLFIINTTGVICGGICGILMAINGFGVWSIAGQGIFSSLIPIPIICSLEKWRPAMVFKKQAAKDLFGFGRYDVLTRLAGFFNNQMNVFILGSLFAPAVVGYFVLANSLTTKILKPVNTIFKKVLFPFFSGIQEDADRIRRYYLEQIKYSSLIVVPFSVSLILFSEKALFMFFGEKWQGAIHVIHILSVLMIIAVIGGTPATVFRSMGGVKLNFKLSMTKVIIRIPCVLLGWLIYGFKGYLFLLLFSQLIFFIIDLYYLQRFIELSLWNILGCLRTIFVSTLSMVVSILLLYLFFDRAENAVFFLSIITGIATFILTYLLQERQNIVGLLTKI